MIKAVRRNKNRKFESAEDKFYRQLSKRIRDPALMSFNGLNKGGKIKWLPEKTTWGRDVLVAYRKTDKYTSRPLLYQMVFKKQ